MITEDYVSFEVANLLKEKGFDEPTGFVYSESGELMKLSDFGVRYLLNSECDDYPHWQFPIEGVSSIVSAPTIQMAMKWLREVHKIEIRVIYDNEKLCWYGACNPMNEPSQILLGFGRKSKSYEEASEEGIKYCLETLS